MRICVSNLLRYMRPVRNDALVVKANDDHPELLDGDLDLELDYSGEQTFSDDPDFWFDTHSYDSEEESWEGYRGHYYDRYFDEGPDEEWYDWRVVGDLYDAYDYLSEERGYSEWLIENQMDQMFEAKEQAELPPPLCEHGYPEDDCDEYEGYDHLMESSRRNLDHESFGRQLERKGARAQRRRNTALRRRVRVALAKQLQTVHRLRFEVDAALDKGRPWKTYSMALSEHFGRPYGDQGQRDMLRMELDQAALDLATPELLDY